MSRKHQSLQLLSFELTRWAAIALLAAILTVALTLAGSTPAAAQSVSGGFSYDFSDGDSSAWTTYGDTWGVTNGQYTVAGDASDLGGKAVVAGPCYANLSYEANVTVGAGGNAGLIFRVTNPAVGPDAYSGYYVGLDSGTGQVVLGKANNGWTQLATAPCAVAAGTQYDIKVTAVGSVLTVLVNGAQKLNVTDATYAAGAVGVRTYAASAAFGKVVVTALDRTGQPFSRKFEYLGNDNGAQEELEQDPGRQWFNLQGQPEDAIHLMASCGFNAVRVTANNQQALISNNSLPYSQAAESNWSLYEGGIDRQVDIARRCKAYGMKVILTIDLGYSIPGAWCKDTYQQMLTDIQNETVRLLDPFLQAGIQPDIIIASNESDGGTLGGDTTISNADNQNPASPNYELQNRYIGGGSQWQVGTGSQDAPANGTIAVFSDEATGDCTIWPKCAGFYKQAILAARAEITAQGYDVTRTRFGLHCQNHWPSWFYSRIFGTNPPNFETDYYDGNGNDLGNVSAVPQSLQEIKLSSLVDVLATSLYVGHAPSDGSDAFEADLNELPYNGFQSNFGGEPTNLILHDFAGYGLSSNLSQTTGLYTAGPYQGEPAKKVIVLETQGEGNTWATSYAVSDTAHANPVVDGNNPTREANFMSYFVNKLAEYPFVAGAMWWEGEDAGGHQFGGLYAEDAPTGSGLINYSALPIMTTWGQFAAPSLIASYTLASADYGTALEVGPYTGSWSSMQGLLPTINQVFQAAADPSGYFTFLNSGTGCVLSTGSNISQTAPSTPPTAVQEWSFLGGPSGGAQPGTNQIISQLSGSALDASNDTYAVQSTPSSAASQQWSLALLPRVNLVSGIGGVLDSGLGNIYWGQWASDQHLGVATPVMSQQWQVINDLDGYSRIVCGEILNVNGNVPLVLGTWNNDMTAGDHVAQTPLGSPIQPGQEWKLVPVGGSGAVQIINRDSGLALDVATGPAVQNPSNPSSASQQWTLTPVY